MADIRSKNQLFLTTVVSYSRTKVDRLKTNWAVICIKINIPDDPMSYDKRP